MSLRNVKVTCGAPAASVLGSDAGAIAGLDWISSDTLDPGVGVVLYEFVTIPPSFLIARALGSAHATRKVAAMAEQEPALLDALPLSCAVLRTFDPSALCVL